MEIKNVQVYGLKESLIRSSYPLSTDIPEMWPILNGYNERGISTVAIDRGKRLGTKPIGSGHDKFLRGIHVQFDMIAPRYFWQEWDTYHFNESISSQSTQHCAAKFFIDEMANQWVDKTMLQILKGFIADYNDNPTIDNFMRIKSNWLEGLELGRGIDSNYASLKTVYSQRQHHKLPEWTKTVCPWIESLPMVRELGVIK